MVITSCLAQGISSILVKPISLPSVLDLFASKMHADLELPRYRLLVIIFGFRLDASLKIKAVCVGILAVFAPCGLAAVFAV